MSIQLDLIEPCVTGYSRVTLDIAAAERTALAIVTIVTKFRATYFLYRK